MTKRTQPEKRKGKQKNFMKCKICDNIAVGKYCELHERAYKNIVEKYKVWKIAIEIPWKEYLKKILENEYSGSWVKEVVQDLVSEKIIK